MNCLVIGASAGVGRALCEELARANHALLAVASDERDLSALAADLQLRFGVRVRTTACSIRHSGDWFHDIKAAADFGEIDALFFPIGFSSEADTPGTGPALARDLLEANLNCVILLAAEFLRPMLARDRGHIIGFGSVAAVRGRSANVVYAAAKRGLESYFESLRHATSGTHVRVQFYRLGYMDTQQAFGRHLLFPKGSPQQLARRVVANLDRDCGLLHFPWFWRWISPLVSALPWRIFRRLRF